MSIATRTPDDVRLNDPDADLVAALRRRDERALMTLVRRHGPMMLRVARSYVGSELAEDVVQETWIAVLRGVDGFGHRALFKTWLIRILVNTACSRRARERRAVFWSPLPEEAPVEDPFDPGPEQRVIAGDLWATVRAALDELPRAAAHRRGAAGRRRVDSGGGERGTEDLARKPAGAVAPGSGTDA